MDEKDLITDDCESTVIDLDSISMNNHSYSSGTDTITITGLDLNSADTITFPSYNSVGTTSYSLGTGISYNTSSTWSNNYSISGGNPPTVKIESNGITMDAGTDIKIGEHSLKEFMTKMEQRLSILVPDPEKLEKFEALKKAYEHYKTMESLCFDEPKEDKE